MLLAGDHRSPALQELLLVSVHDIGYFEPMWSHLLLPSPSEVVISRMDRSSSGTGGGMQSVFGDMQVAGRGLQVAMAEQQLNAAQIGACVEQVGGKGVTQHMRAERLDHAQLATQLLAD